jgi:hypothetical protein
LRQEESIDLENHIGSNQLDESGHSLPDESFLQANNKPGSSKHIKLDLGEIFEE